MATATAAPSLAEQLAEARARNATLTADNAELTRRNSELNHRREAQAAELAEWRAIWAEARPIILHRWVQSDQYLAPNDPIRMLESRLLGFDHAYVTAGDPDVLAAAESLRAKLRAHFVPNDWIIETWKRELADGAGLTPLDRLAREIVLGEIEAAQATTPAAINSRA